MSARVTATEVKAILSSRVSARLSDATVNSFIAGATLLVDNAIGSATDLSDDLKKEIERWFTAHMISCSIERMAESEGADGTSIKYTGRYGKGLESTPYGQTVISLDATGRMAALGKQAASMTAVASFT